MEFEEGRGRLAWAGLPFALVLLIAVLVHQGFLADVDRAGLLALRPSPDARWIVSAATTLGDPIARIGIVAIVAAAFLIRGMWRRVMALVLVVAGGAALNSVLKVLVARPRPDLLPHLDAVSSMSFPSGHAANSLIVYVALAMMMPSRYRVAGLSVAALLISLIGITRVMLAVHWPSDVVAGWCVGIGWLLLWQGALRPTRAG